MFRSRYVKIKRICFNVLDVFTYEKFEFIIYKLLFYTTLKEVLDATLFISKSLFCANLNNTFLFVFTLSPLDSSTNKNEQCHCASMYVHTFIGML